MDSRAKSTTDTGRPLEATEMESKAQPPVEPNPDPLTGLYSEAGFAALLNQAISSFSYRQSPMTLALLQLANFYEIRTWVGGSEASLLLNDIAAILAQTVPPGTIVCHCHRHEFAILLSGEGSRRALAIADRIKQVAQTCNSQVIPPQLSLVCGVGVSGISALTPNSDVAFARARHHLSRQHRNEDSTQSELELDPSQHGALLATLRLALEKNLLGVSFQATISFKPQPLGLYEIRTRLVDNNVEIPANAFIDVAIQNALGEALDRWVITEAISRLSSRPDSPFRFLINVTQTSIASKSFLVWLENCLANHGWVASRLVLQVSELDVLISQHHMANFCRNLKQLGIQLSISHFGCTPDPLRYLSLISADFIKLDHTLYLRPNLDIEGRHYLEQLITAVHQRNMMVIAPMVEQINTLPILWKAGVDSIQGDGLHKAATKLDYHFTEQTELTVC